MKKGICIFLALLFTTQSFFKLAVYLNYQANKEYIAKTLCEKKTEPESCCEGKCHLKKQLDKVDDIEEGRVEEKSKSSKSNEKENKGSSR